MFSDIVFFFLRLLCGVGTLGKGFGNQVCVLNDLL